MPSNPSKRCPVRLPFRHSREHGSVNGNSDYLESFGIFSDPRFPFDASRATRRANDCFGSVDGGHSVYFIFLAQHVLTHATTWWARRG
jgi:hypothetical protein